MSTWIKKLIKDITPPIVLRYLKHSKKLSTIFNDYDDAMKDADGYEDEILTKVVVAKGKSLLKKISANNHIKADSLRTVIGLASVINTSNKLTIIDFGGAAGTHYFIARSIISNHIALDWRIVETTAMVNEAKKEGLENSELRFFDNIDAAEDNSKIDLVFASGSIHCTPKPYEILESLASLKSNIFMITRTPVTNFPCVLLQYSKLSDNGVGEIPKNIFIKDKKISYPVTMMDRKRVENILMKYGDIRLKTLENRDSYLSKKHSYNDYGYIVTKDN